MWGWVADMRPVRWCRISPLLLLLIHCLIQSVRAWVLVSREGEVTLLGPVDIDPSFNQDAKLTFRSKGARRANFPGRGKMLPVPETKMRGKIWSCYLASYN
eukprot:Skav209501  [mRNA]  locus=scaffold2767:10745:13375:+ [translate_table: standard]